MSALLHQDASGTARLLSSVLAARFHPAAPSNPMSSFTCPRWQARFLRCPPASSAPQCSSRARQCAHPCRRLQECKWPDSEFLYTTIDPSAIPVLPRGGNTRMPPHSDPGRAVDDMVRDVISTYERHGEGTEQHAWLQNVLAMARGRNLWSGSGVMAVHCRNAR